MATGTDSFMGKAMPILGNAQLTSETAADDILTLTGAAIQTGNYMVVAVKSTTACTTLSESPNAFTVTATSKSIFNAIVHYDSGDAPVGTCGVFFAVDGSKAPTYLLSVASSKLGIGAATDNGFFNASMDFSPSTASAWAGLKILAGSKAYYILAVPDTGVTA